MADPGFISGMTGYAIQLAGNQIVAHINIAVRCRKELDALKHMLHRVVSINSEMQEYRRILNSGQINASSDRPLPSAVNSWLNKLNDLLQEASHLAQHCTVPSSCHLISRYQTSRKITHLISVIEEHLNSTPFIAFLHQLQRHVVHRQGHQQITESINSLSLKLTASTILAGTTGDCFPSTSSNPLMMKYIEEHLIVGQDYACTKIEELIDSAQHKNVFRIGLVGMGGSGKTLILKRVFNSHQVQGIYSNDLLLWLTVSKTPSFKALIKDLVKQISLRINNRLDSREEEDVKIWLSGRFRENKFALFLDDVWDTSANSLLAELCVPLSPHHNSNNIIIASSRISSVLKQLGVPPPSILQVQELGEDDSWQLFSCHAFPHSDGYLPMGIDEETARRVCNECGGLPLALKVIGQAMAGFTHLHEWEFALKRLKNVDKYGDVTDSLYGRLRMSYDALADLDIALQLCFLYLAAFPEDQVITVVFVSMYWIGEGFLTGPDPFQIGQRFVNLLADRCLIEPLGKYSDGKVVCFRVHDVLLDLAQQIAEKEEKCFFRADRNLQEFPADDCSAHLRISLMDNSLTNVPNTFRSSHTRSWLLRGNLHLNSIPEQVIGSMISLRVLDLSETALYSLPKSLGRLKHLVCLCVRGTLIKKLPNSITALTHLQILDLCNSHITKLPSTISMLTSLKLLDISNCEHLQSIPSGISQLTSLEYLGANDCPYAWIKKGRTMYKRELLSINDLGTLKQLKRLNLENNGEIVLEGTLGSMKHMEYLRLGLTNMESLPQDMISMSKLRKLYLNCPHLFQIEDSFYGFQHLSYINLFACGMLKQLPALHKLVSLKHLDIIACCNIGKLPKEFGTSGAFPNLQVFSLVELEKLNELPIVEGGAMSSLKTFTIMKCEVLHMLPESYWNLKSMEKIRIYGCSMVFNAIEEKFIKTKRKVQTITLSITDTHALQKRFFEMVKTYEVARYSEIWCNELFQFLQETYLKNVLLVM